MSDQISTSRSITPRALPVLSFDRDENRSVTKVAHNMEEFKKLLDRRNADQNLIGKYYIVENINFKEYTELDFISLDITGIVFVNCYFPCPPYVVQQKHGEIIYDGLELPFKRWRTLYSPEELAIHDEAILEYYVTHRDYASTLSQTTHDLSIQRDLFHILEGRPSLGIMGGHGIKTDSPIFKTAARLSYSLGRRGFVICTGGGPGAMEAGNLGGYFSNKLPEELEEGIQIMADNPETGGQEIIAKFGRPCVPNNIGVPTYRFGDEKSNLFPTWIAKFFSNALREYALLDLSVAGIVFFPGAAGTRQEIFQVACMNDYAPMEKLTKPMIFIGTDYWNESGVYEMITRYSADKNYAKYVLLTDDIEEAADLLLLHALDKGMLQHNIEE
eukprot:TRINITY_DN12110_c0_g1_i1.p1 TRINITY_DN12110_c0_g1~~TRINITY_DN12110_c0_g1_i1.p1  ORF type:complete len:387 (-),score=88.08 TRINITY_DN12110_c0_g1_i1:34-1194(-)